MTGLFTIVFQSHLMRFFVIIKSVFEKQ